MNIAALPPEDLAALRIREPLFYFADLLLDDGLRVQAQLLHAVHAEINQITTRSTDPMVGQIRLQWWSDVVSGQRDGEAANHPIASRLVEAIRSDIFAAERLEAKIDAHIFDIYNDLMPDVATLETWCGETRSVLFQQLVAQDVDVGGAVADACGHAGVALGICDILQSLPNHRPAQRCFVPATLLTAHGLASNDWFGPVGESHTLIVRELAELALTHLEKATVAVREAKLVGTRLFAPLRPIRSVLTAYATAGSDVFERPITLGQLKMQWQLYRGLR